MFDNQSQQSPAKSSNPLPFRSNHSVNPQLDDDDDNQNYIFRKRQTSFNKLAINRSMINNHSTNYKLQAAMNSCDNKFEGDKARMEATYINNNHHYRPPSPSSVCSTSPSPPYSPVNREPELVISHSQTQSGCDQASSSKMRAINTSRRYEKDVSISGQAISNIPDSPTGSIASSSSDAGLLTLLASKLLSYAERRKRHSRYSRENSTSGPIEKHVMMENRSIKPPVETLDIDSQQDQSQLHDDRSHGQLHRAPSEATSMYSLGSANDRTFSMEFDAMLAAAAATQTYDNMSSLTTMMNHGNILQSPQRALQDIQEGQSLRYGSVDQQQIHDPSSRLALVRVADSFSHSNDGEETARSWTNALVETRQGRDFEDMDYNNNMSGTLVGSGAESEENNSNLQLVPTTTLQDTASSSYSGTSSPQVRSTLTGTSSSSNSSSANILNSRDNKNNIVPASKHPAQPPPLEKLRRDKAVAQANAYQDAKTARYNNRYKREESKINAWENQQKIKATIKMKKVEMELEQKRARALEEMENEIALAHKKAEEKKACAEAIRAAKIAKVTEVVNQIKRSGKPPKTRCFPFN